MNTIHKPNTIPIGASGRCPMCGQKRSPIPNTNRLTRNSKPYKCTNCWTVGNAVDFKLRER